MRAQPDRAPVIHGIVRRFPHRQEVLTRRVVLAVGAVLRLDDPLAGPDPDTVERRPAAPGPQAVFRDGTADPAAGRHGSRPQQQDMPFLALLAENGAGERQQVKGRVWGDAGRHLERATARGVDRCIGHRPERSLQPAFDIGTGPRISATGRRVRSFDPGRHSVQCGDL